MSLRIVRRIVVDRGTGTERTVSQSEIATISGPIVILGEPGLGKSMLCDDLAKAEGCTLVSATRLLLGGRIIESPFTQNLIVDGLDEVSSSVPGAAVDAVVAKLSDIGWPNFVLSCRSTDWRGAADRYKIRQVYGRDPTVLHLEPLILAEAQALLTAWYPRIGAKIILDRLDARGLAEIYGNPLSLRLLGEASKAGEAIPEDRSGILQSACRALLREENDAHKAAGSALVRPESLLDAAGAIFAGLLLTGNVGVYLGAQADAPSLYIPKADFTAFVPRDALDAAIRTRLFHGEGENRIGPLHRVVAEYLGARWLAQQIRPDQSPRRVLQLVHFQDGVPSSLRGLHAWLGHFSSTVSDNVIRADPFGVIRYGDGDRLSEQDARTLLSALCNLVEDDPYFRAEDWAERRIGALAKPILRDDILAVLRKPQRPFHLSTLLLNAIAGSEVSELLQTDLEAIVLDQDALYGERAAAADSLRACARITNWRAIVGSLLTQGSRDSARLAVETVSHVNGEGFSAQSIVEAALQNAGLTICGIPRKDDQQPVVGVSNALANALPLEKLVDVLDLLTVYAAPFYDNASWESQWNVREFAETVILRALESEIAQSGWQIWPWIRYLDKGGSADSHRAEEISAFFTAQVSIRHAVQAVAFADTTIAESVWMRAHALAEIGFGLYPNGDDVVSFLNAFVEKQTLSISDQENWKDFVQIARCREGLPHQVIAAAEPVADRYLNLRKFLDNCAEVRIPEWERQQQERRRLREAEQARKFAADRDAYFEHIDEIKKGNVGWLTNLAKAYIGHFTDLDRNADPGERLKEWLGPQLEKAGKQGFIAALSNPDLPTASDIATLHVQDKKYHAEAIMICGVAEMLRKGVDLSLLPEPVLLATWIAWQPSGDHGAKALRRDVGQAIEPVLFSDNHGIEKALRLQIEPQLDAGREHIPGLYRARHDARMQVIFWRLAFEWLQHRKRLPLAIECELLDTVLNHAPLHDGAKLVKERLARDDLTAEQRQVWLSAGFVVDFSAHEIELRSVAAANRNFLWGIRARVSRDHWSIGPIPSKQLGFIIEAFGLSWPPAESPGSSNGDTNPWDASRFITSAITKLGADMTDEGVSAMARLLAMNKLGYAEYIRHAASQQRRLRRDALYKPPILSDIASVVCAGPPRSMGDLKAYVLDHLDDLQTYLRGSDVDTRMMFYNGDIPLIENECRNRLIDLLRFRVLNEVQLLPEIQMPELKRVDIDVVCGKMGLPIEIKGQWHKDLWGAPTAQLDSLYTRDWRAEGYGVFLALWFGETPRKKLRAPDKGPTPSSPQQLREMLAAGVPADRRTKIPVVVLDLSLSR